MKFSKINCSGTTALVTGASSGIGLEYCRVLAHNGVDLLMVSNQEQELLTYSEEIRQQTGVKVHTLFLDLATPDAARTLMAHVKSLGLNIDLLINNAGIFSFKKFTETSQERIRLFIDLHVTFVTELTRLMALDMEARGGGRILNMSSMSCWTPYPGIAMYAATKAYIRVLSRAVGYEMRERGVRITVACPGGIATDLFGLPENLKHLAVRIGAIQTPQKFVVKALKATYRGKKQYINGWLNRIAIVAASVCPTSLRLVILHKLL